MLFAMLGVGTLSAQTDVTDTYLTNADLSSLDGWTRSDYTDWKTDGDANVIEFYHTWGANAGTAIGSIKEFYFKQNATLPAGEYRIAVNAFYREGNGDGTNTKAYIFAGEERQYIVGLNSGALSSYTGSNDLYKAANAFSQGAFSNAFDFTVEEETSMELGFSGNIDTYCSWCILGPVKLYQYSMDDFNAELTAAREKLQAVTGLNEAMQAKVTTMITETENVTQTKAEILAATAKVNALYDEVVAFSAPYATLNDFITLCQGYKDNSDANSDEILSTFTTAIETATTNGNAATTEDELTTIYNTLEAARQTYASNATPTNGTYFDYTFKITNPSFETGDTDGWTVPSDGDTGARSNSDGTYTINGADGNYVFNTWGGSGFYVQQTLTELPSGLYTLKAIVASDANNTITLTAGSTSADVTITTNLSTATEAIVENAACTGGDFLIKASSSAWFKADHFRLYYYGNDPTAAQTSVANLKSEAEGLVSNKMNIGVLATLNEAINNADASNTDLTELENMSNTLQTAIDNAKTSIADYETILTYITKANGIDESIAAEYQTAYGDGTISESAETVFQSLEVATYTYVTKNFTYDVTLSDTWNSTGTNTQAATFSNEHWSGETREYKNQYDGSGQGWNASAWSIDFDQEVTLPAGEYVFKVAGRKSTEATLELVVTTGETTLGTVNDFPSSNAALGINKAGAASFDANDEAGFANSGKGFGWQWRYVKFTLDAETAVKVAVHAEANAVHQWVSFGDYTLQMTEETYLKANKGALDEPTAQANALVNTKPMGTAENTALQEALEMTYTTGAGLKAKIEALETAVAAANTWVTAYNTEKADLVTALERFEADYNNAENGAIDHMNKTRWATVIEKAQAAAEAKDITDSYDGFEAATTALTEALDAADESITDYAELKKAIEANTDIAEGINWGDGIFQRPESAKDGLTSAITTAQGIYDAASLDGEDVTAAVEELNNAEDGIVLNAPEADAVFYWTVASEGHTLEGNAVVASLGTTGDNNPTGYGFNAKTEATDYNQRIFTFTQVEEGSNLYNISVPVNDEIVYLTYGSKNGSAAGWSTQQIQGTTDKATAGQFKIEASPAVDGAFRIYNTEYNGYVACEEGGSIYTNNDLTRGDFALATTNTESAIIYVDPANMWSSCVLPFDVDASELPTGLRAFQSVEVKDKKIVLEEVTTGLEAYTPYLLYAEAGCDSTALSGTVDLAGYDTVVVDKNSCLHGVIGRSHPINEGYVMQNRGSGVKFYCINMGANGETVDTNWTTIATGKCWLVVPDTNITTFGARSVTFSFRGGETNDIKGVAVEADEPTMEDGIYTIDGKRVSDTERGKVYIINGQKVMVGE